VTNKEYRAHEGISKSSLWEINKSPLHFKYKMDNPQTDTAALLFGRAVHKFVLEEDDFWNEFAVAPICDRRTKDGKETWTNFELKSVGKDLVKAEDFGIIKDMKVELLKNEMVVNLLTGKKEVSLFGVDELTGEKIKARPDILTEIGDQLIIVDYKSCDSAETDAFMRSALKYGYHLQDALYSEVVKQNYGKEPIFIFIAQEKTEPYAVNILQTDQYFRQYGNDVFRELIGIFHECKTTGNWYGYETSFNQVNNLSLPEWLLKRME
jgi:ATP-dependent exoDNAse (exonuclease V) beta subunit